jgi:hypothetical protein
MADFHAGSVAAITHRARPGCRDGAAHAPKFQPRHGPMKSFRRKKANPNRRHPAGGILKNLA